MYNQFDHKCPFCGKNHGQPHYKRSRHERVQNIDCPLLKHKLPKQPQANHPCHNAKGQNKSKPNQTIVRRGPAGPPGPTGATGSNGITGPTGATGIGLSGIVAFDPAIAPTYPVGQVVTFEGGTYIVNTAPPSGTPDTSPDYTILAAPGSTGDTGATGATGVTGDA
ncbi:complement C1q tumor necrosis factor-like protein 9B, partial [Bacillus zhangzhouensis]